LPPLWTIPLWASLVHCTEPLRAPSAFSDEHYLCGTPEFDALVARCHEDYLGGGPCLGWVSFRGTIDTQQVLVDAPATKVIPPVPGRVSDTGFEVWGLSPYFQFRLTFLNAEAPSVGSSNSAGAISAGATNSSKDFINLEARGGNYLAGWINETRQVQILTADEIRFNFAADLVRGGHLDGCLDVFLGDTP
jgi:hypothetical protein